MRWLRFLQCLYILPRCGAFPCFFTALLHCLVTDLANQTCSCFSCKNFHLRGASQRWEWEEASHRLERGEVPLIVGVGASHRWDWRCWAVEGLSALPALRLNRRSVTCKRSLRSWTDENKPHLSADCVQMVPTSVQTLVHDFQPVDLVAQGMIVVQILFLSVMSV